jgi:hypothetical protein
LKTRGSPAIWDLWRVFSFRGENMQVAFLIDGGFLEKKFKSLMGNFPLPQEVLEICHLAMQDVEFKNDQLFRIYYYDCEPFSGTTTHPVTGQQINFSTSPVFVRKKRFFVN